MATPFLKWAGGKARLLPHIMPMVARGYSRYLEPMLGGGGIFFGLEHRCATLSDSNPYLVITCGRVRDQVENLIDLLWVHELSHSRAYYDKVRARNPDRMSALKMAARFIYLNRTCFNGLYRVNSMGRFNVSMGDYKKPNICNRLVLRAASAALKNVVIREEDVANALSRADANTFVYVDPPYVPVSETANFTSFTVDGFTNEDHVRLRNAALAAYQRGATVVLSNSDTPFVRELYKTFQMKVIPAVRRINCKGKKRGNVNELLIWKEG